MQNIFEEEVYTPSQATTPSKPQNQVEVEEVNPQPHQINDETPGTKATAQPTKSEPKQQAPKKQVQNQVVEAKQDVTTSQPKTLEAIFLKQVEDYAMTSGETIDNRTKAFAVDIITASTKQLMSTGTSWNQVNVAGCGFVSQIKRWAKLGVGAEDHLFIDIRNNSATGLKDITIKPQYQTLEKLMVTYFTKPILRFKEDIICIGDEIMEEEDFYTGLNKIVGHKRNYDIDRNKFDNIEGAYKIAYVKEGNNVVQYVVKIDKNRIVRARNASASKEKTVWNNDTRKMVLKTVAWEMWNDKNIRAFMKFPDTVLNDVSIVEENEEMNWKETKYNSVEEANNAAKTEVASGDSLSMSYEE